jgi:hypothetical protein
MSQWTHVSGVIRFESLAANVYPPPPNKNAILELEKDIVAQAFREDLPGGSEGPVEVVISYTSRGPTAQITGDLRDFGKEDLGRILEWANAKAKEVFDKTRVAFQIPNFVRDAFIYCEVEYDNNLHLILLDRDKGKFGEFVMKEIKQKEG